MSDCMEQEGIHDENPEIRHSFWFRRDLPHLHAVQLRALSIRDRPIESFSVIGPPCPFPDLLESNRRSTSIESNGSSFRSANRRPAQRYPQ